MFSHGFSLEGERKLAIAVITGNNKTMKIVQIGTGVVAPRVEKGSLGTMRANMSIMKR